MPDAFDLMVTVPGHRRWWLRPGWRVLGLLGQVRVPAGAVIVYRRDLEGR